MRIGIGIDTGGTCTDAVAYDYQSGRLLAKGKAPTTRENLSIGIGQALDMLPGELISSCELISLSTTLATNACVENKGCRAKLLIFGMTDELVQRFKGEKNYGLRAGDVRCIDNHSSADGLSVDEPDWDELFEQYGDWLADADAMSAAELYSIFNGAPCEKRFGALAEERLGVPCVCASELTGEVNVLARGATALLNARLLPIVREFIEAALHGFAERGCNAPVMVVRSDGSLMSAELSLRRPVETILSGPAASVIAGRAYTGRGDYFIVDMGGTTTDVSVVRGGKPVAASDGIRLGGWRTHVKGVFAEPFALGGDSTVRAEKGELTLSARRCMPICAAASRWADVKERLSALLAKKRVNQFPLHELLYLVREPADRSRYGMYELRLIDALEGGPLLLDELGVGAGIDLYHLNSERLEAEGVVMRCGLTPTDFMHILGDYKEYDGEASRIAAEYLLMCLGRTGDTPEDLAREVYGLVEGRMYENLLRILLAQKYPDKFGSGVDEQTLFLIREAWKGRGGDGDGFLRHAIGTDAALIGLGAPTHVFLPEVARALGAECVLPEDAEVANALGALKAEINASVHIDISQRLSSTGRLYYIAHLPSGSRPFDALDEAIAAASAEAETAALEEARSRGASGEVTPVTRVERHTASSGFGSGVSLGCTVVSEAYVMPVV